MGIFGKWDKAGKFSILCKSEIINSNNAVGSTESPEVIKTNWNHDLKSEFRNSFDQEELDNILQDLDNLLKKSF